MNFIEKLILGVLFWNFFGGEEEVLQVDEFEDCDFEEMELE